MGQSIIQLQLKQAPFEFVCRNERGAELNLSANAGIGGNDAYFRPMESLLASLAGCSAIDVLNILRKQKVEPSLFEMTVTGSRVDNAVPGVYTSIKVLFTLNIGLDEMKLKKALQLTQEKYCSVLFMITKDCRIHYDYALK